MTNTAKALKAFFNGFDIPAYAEHNIPENARPPYITYQVVEPEWRDSATMHARIWYRSTSMTAIDAKAREIKHAIGEGVSIPTEDGAIWLFKGNPFSQYMPMQGDKTLKVIYLNLVIHALTD